MDTPRVAASLHGRCLRVGPRFGVGLRWRALDAAGGAVVQQAAGIDS